MSLIFINNMHGMLLSKTKGVLQLLMFFQKNLGESNRKPNKMWVNKGWKLYDRLKKSWLEKII